MLKQSAKLSFRAIKWLLITVLVLALLLIIGSFFLKHSHGINSLNAFIHSHTLGFTIWQCLIFLVTAYFYPTIVKKLLSSKEGITDDQVNKYAKRRWIILIFILYEALIVHNILSPVINWFLGFSG